MSTSAPEHDTSATDAGRLVRWIVTAVVVVAVVIGLIVGMVAFTSTYNTLIAQAEATDEAWGQVESAYQRRADLVPNLVDSIERFMEQEREVLESVTANREGASLSKQLEALKAAQAEAKTGTSGDGPPQSAQALAKLKQSQGKLSERMMAIMGRVENYPQLRSSDQFLRLQAQLEGTENRVNVARQRYNEAVSELNTSIRGLPGRWVAPIAGVEQRAYFEADEGATDAPSIGE